MKEHSTVRHAAQNMWVPFTAALQGKASLARVFWVDGLLGSVLLSAVGALIDPSSERLMRIFIAFALLYTVYATVATYRCAGNCRSKAMTQFVRVSTLVCVIVGVPLVAFLYFSGALNGIVSTLSSEP